MKSFVLPSWWHGAGILTRAGWLVNSGHARNFSEACSMLAKRKKAVVTAAPVVARLPYKD